MSDKFILILGGSNETIFAMQSIREIGYKILLVGIEPVKKALELADEFIELDLKEVNKIIQAVNNYNVVLVLPTPLGRIVTTLGQINSALNLSGVNAEQADILTDKRKFYETFADELNLAKQFSVISAIQVLENLKQEADFFENGFILKPRFGSGSNGVRFFDKSVDLVTLEKYFQEFGSLEILMEEFITYQEYGADVIISENKVYILSISKKKMASFPFRQELEYEINTEFNNGLMIEVLKKIILKLNLSKSFLNIDFLFKDKKIYILDIAPRAGGNYLVDTFIYTLGFNPYIEFIKMYLNQNYCFKVKKNKPSFSSFIYFPKEFYGKYIEKIEPFDDIKELVFLDCKLKAGDKIGLITNGTDAQAQGYFILQGDSKAIQAAKQKLYSKFKIK